MSISLMLTAAVLGGHHRCQSPCYNPCGTYSGYASPIVYSSPCLQPALVPSYGCIEMAVPVACAPVEEAAPVSKVEDEAEPVRSLEEERAIAAADGASTLSNEMGIASSDVGTGVSAVSTTPAAVGGPPITGFLPGLANPGGGNGFSLGNGMTPPGTGAGAGGGFGGGFGGGRTNGGNDVVVDRDEAPANTNTNTQQMPVVNVTINGGSSLSLNNNIDLGEMGDIVTNITNSNSNSNSNSQTQSQNQMQSQTQTQMQDQMQNQQQCQTCNGGGEQVPLPPTVWMGLLGVASVFFVRRNGLLA